MTQYGFFFDQSRCTGCHACTILCKSWNNLQPGPVKWMRVFQWETGNLTDIRVHVLAMPCYHCENLVCARACPAQAIHKEEKFGAVLVDEDRCAALHEEMDCRRCWQACPYGAPQFESDSHRATMSKCTMCVDRLYAGNKPVCVLGCSLRALDFDTLDNIRKWYGPGDDVEGLPSSKRPKPSVVFRKHMPKRQLVRWDPNDALNLWQNRGPFAPPTLTSLFDSNGDVTDVPAGMVKRDRLVLKPSTVEDLMCYTRDDE